tara:strand:+ start:802 stop:972 length:171 start_codon:yes stop_codon:yes gene_type:complete
MPYERKGKCVYKQGESDPVGCSDSAEKAKKYLKKLYSVEEIVREEIKKYLKERKNK